MYNLTVSSMYNPRPLLSLKKTFFYKFFPSKEEEEACKANNTPWVATRELIEIQDIYPPPIIDQRNPWQIKKKITRDEINNPWVVIPFFETFEHILRYWPLGMAKDLVEQGHWVIVDMWDLTEPNVPKKYERLCILRRLHNDDYSLWCMELFKNHRLGVGDEIGLYWDPRSSTFMFKLLSKVLVIQERC